MNELQFGLLQGIVGEKATLVPNPDPSFPAYQYSMPRYDGMLPGPFCYTFRRLIFAYPPAANAIIPDLIEKTTTMSPIMLELLRIDVDKLKWTERATKYWVAFVPTELGVAEFSCGQPGVTPIWAMTHSLVAKLIEKRWLEDRAARELAPSETTFNEMEQAIVDELKPVEVPDSVGSSVKL